MKKLLTIFVLMIVALSANAQSCPDNNHPHMIDLGLPSRTKWACCNVGADKPEAYGGFYAWGETEEKSYYDWSSYIHCDGSDTTCHNLGNDIAGTNYDVAHHQWGDSWVMPSFDQWDELKVYSTCESMAMNGVMGLKVTSSLNGASIFIPKAGMRRGDDIYEDGGIGFYSLSYSPFILDMDSQYYWFVGGSGMGSFNTNRENGLTVRPVSQ